MVRYAHGKGKLRLLMGRDGVKAGKKEGSQDGHSFAVSNHELVWPRGFKTRMQA